MTIVFQMEMATPHSKMHSCCAVQAAHLQSFGIRIKLDNPMICEGAIGVVGSGAIKVG